MQKLLLAGLLLAASTFLAQAQEWQTDFVEAQKIASQNGHNIILVFQGSDWCAPCIKLDREIWSTTEFQNFADDHFVMLKADFPRRKKNRLEKNHQEKNNALAEKYNPQGIFPLVVLLNKDGRVLGKTGYQSISPKEYIEVLVAMEN